LKPERWGSLLVQEEYQEEMPVTRDIHNNNNNNNNPENNHIGHCTHTSESTNVKIQ
jgi:hypothetical protein